MSAINCCFVNTLCRINNNSSSGAPTSGGGAQIIGVGAELQRALAQFGSISNRSIVYGIVVPRYF